MRAQLCPTLCDRIVCSLSVSSVHGIFQAGILEWVAISFSRGSFRPRDQTHISCVSCIGRRILYHQIAFVSHTLIVQSLVVPERHKVSCLEQVIVDIMCQLDRIMGCIEISVQFSSVAQACLTLCNPMDCCMPGLPVYHHLLELTQTHVH